MTRPRGAADRDLPPPPPPPLLPPARWLHAPRVFPPLPHLDLGPQHTRANKLSATRSPSLEKDDKSPFLNSGKSDQSEVFGFDTEGSKRSDEVPVESEELERSSSPVDTVEGEQSPGNLRRYRSVSTRLNMCSVTEGDSEASNIQNSSRHSDCESAKEKSSTSKFEFSPKLLSDSFSSPKYFTPPENITPMFFAESSPKSVYYDSVRSPKFFAETPRADAEVPQSPRAFGDHHNRNVGIRTILEKPTSPKVVLTRSPKIHSRNKENYFTFDPSSIVEDSATSRLSPMPRRYGGRNSIEREHFTPPADKEAKLYRRHNSCDTNFKNVEINITKLDNKDDDVEQEVDDDVSADVVDCIAKMHSMVIDNKVEMAKDKRTEHLNPTPLNTAQARRQRLKSISLDSDNAKIIEQNLGLPIAKHMKDHMNEVYKNQDVSTSCHSMDRSDSFTQSPTDKPAFEFSQDEKEPENEEECKSPNMKQKKGLRQSCDTQSFLDMPRFSPKEFEIIITSEEEAMASEETPIKRKGSKNLRNLTIDLTKRDSELEKELLEFEKLYTNAEEKKVKTPTLKVKATSLDSSESMNLSLPQKKTLDVPQNSVSVPNTPKRLMKRILAQKKIHDQCSGGKVGFNTLQYTAEQRKMFMKGQDSGIFLRENHANLMLYQPGTSRMGSRAMGSFDEDITDLPENTPEINISGVDGNHQNDHMLGSNLLNYKPNLSVSSTNLKTLPEGVTSDDFEPNVEDEKFGKKLHRRNSNQSLMHSFDGKYSTHSLQSSNCSLSSAGTSCHNLASVRSSASNFSLNTDNRQKKLSLERRDSNASMMVSMDQMVPSTRVIGSFNTSSSGEGIQMKNGLLQRRESNNSLTLNIQSSPLSRHSSNSSLNKDKLGQKKGLLERRSSNTSLTLNINNSHPQLSTNRSLSISNYNLNGSTCNLSRYCSNQSIDNTSAEPRKGILERRCSNTSLTANLQPQEPRALEIDVNILQSKLPNKHAKSLSTENLLPKNYKHLSGSGENKSYGFGSHGNLWSSSFADQEYPQNLTYVCGDQENEIIYAFGRRVEEGPVRNITTKPLSPQSTTEEFRLYLANIQYLQTASSVLSGQQLRDLNELFQNGYSKVKCGESSEGPHCCTGRVPEAGHQSTSSSLSEAGMQPCSEYQKTLLRSLHQEFWDMPSNFQEKPIVSGSHIKNRYKTILPNDHSRVILRPEPGGGERYINANYIKGHEYTKNSYIATQGPLPNTIFDFWLMVRQNCIDTGSPNSKQKTTKEFPIQKVVMLTNIVENDKQKCEKYFPLELNEDFVIDNPEMIHNGLASSCFVIKNTGAIKKTGYTIRKLEVSYKNNQVISKSESATEGEGVSESENTIETRITVYHYWFHNWADHKCPKDVNALLNLSLDILKDTKYDFSENVEEGRDDERCKCGESPKRDFKFVFPPHEAADTSSCEVKLHLSNSPLDFSKENSSPPVVVHCSAGIGRTGCLLAILNGIKQLSCEGKVDVLGIVCNMRLNRGGMVQSSEQYELIHKVLCVFEQSCMSL